LLLLALPLLCCEKSSSSSSSVFADGVLLLLLLTDDDGVEAAEGVGVFVGDLRAIKISESGNGGDPEVLDLRGEMLVVEIADVVVMLLLAGEEGMGTGLVGEGLMEGSTGRWPNAAEAYDNGGVNDDVEATTGDDVDAAKTDADVSRGGDNDDEASA
jgi:hypothetical protein